MNCLISFQFSYLIEPQLVCFDYVACEDLTVTPTLVASMTGTSYVYATALLNDQLFVTRHGVIGVAVYNTISLQPIRAITYSGFSAYLGSLAASAIDNYLYVADSSNLAVYRVDLSVTNTVSVLTWRLSPDPHGYYKNPNALSMSRDNNVLVATSTGTIEEYTPLGSFVRIITTSNPLWQGVQVNNDVWAFIPYSGTSQIMHCTKDERHRDQVLRINDWTWTRTCHDPATRYGD